MTKQERVIDYLKTVVNSDLKGAKLLAEILAPTLSNNSYIRRVSTGKGGVNVTDFKKGQLCVAFSTADDYHGNDLKKQAEGLVYQLKSIGDKIGATPITFTSNVDSKDSNVDMIKDIANGFKKGLDEIGAGAVNGENAVLSDMLRVPANLSGTMIAYVDRNSFPHLKGDSGVFIYKGVEYIYFDPKGKSVFASSDGVGTKMLIHLRNGKPEIGIRDFIAMVVDDILTSGGTLMGVSGVIERSDFSRDYHMMKMRNDISELLGIPFSLDFNYSKGKIRSFQGSLEEGCNINGTALSVIDENILKNPLRPNVGDIILAVQAPDINGRSNGYTSKRQLARMALESTLAEEIKKGKNIKYWHETSIGRELLEYLSTPSQILYPDFKPLLDSGLVSSLNHKSGGAFKGKFAERIAKYGLYANLKNLHKPHPLEVMLLGQSGYSLHDIYSQWGMGNDALITTSNPQEAISILQAKGYKVNVVGEIKQGINAYGATLETFDGKKVHYLVKP